MQVDTTTLKPTKIKEFLLYLIGRRKRFKVDGRSMLPLLKPDDDVLARPLNHKTQLQVGDIVVARHPHLNILIIKYCKEIDDNKIFLEGLNQNESNDSHDWGCLPRANIQAIVTSKLTNLEKS